MTTKAQFKALWAAFKFKNAVNTRGSRMGGAKMRMVDRMVKEGLLSTTPPYPITTKGLQALHKACDLRWAKDGGQAYKEELDEVEAALK